MSKRRGILVVTQEALRVALGIPDDHTIVQLMPPTPQSVAHDTFEFLVDGWECPEVGEGDAVRVLAPFERKPA